MSWTEAAIPYGLRLSLLSPQPTSPLSVSTRTNVHGRQPPSQCSASTFAIFMDDPSRGRQAERAPGLGGEAFQRRGVHVGPRGVGITARVEIDGVQSEFHRVSFR